MFSQRDGHGDCFRTRSPELGARHQLIFFDCSIPLLPPHQCSIMLRRLVILHLAFLLSQADVGPFVPQRFEPPADAWWNEARGVRQVHDPALGDILFASASSLVNEAREKRTDLMYEYDTEDPTKGYQTMVDRQIEWGMLSPKVTHETTSVARWLGQTASTSRAQQEEEEEKDHGWKWQSWQPAAGGSSSSSLWHATGAGATTWGGSNWWHQGSWAANAQSRQPAPAASHRAPALRQPLPMDPRVTDPSKISRYWGSGARREYWEW